MKRLLFLASICIVLSSCGGKKEEQAITPEQESLMVDSVATELDEATTDLNNKADSVTADVDSLLQGI
jgi:hypothetical protein